MIKLYLIALIQTLFGAGCNSFDDNSSSKTISNIDKTMQVEINNSEISKDSTIAIAVVAGGCFWCVEAQYLLLPGVVKVESGYAGGKIKNPSYKEICTGLTGHAEVIKVYYNKEKLTYTDILRAFFISHDPTTLNRQGNDVGTQYRSAIFYENETQKTIARDIINKLNNEKAYDNIIVTTLEPLTVFYKAEDYHQNYYNLNKDQPYCQFVISPKIEKFRKVFGH